MTAIPDPNPDPDPPDPQVFGPPGERKQESNTYLEILFGNITVEKAKKI
jgi:hypothetical protein